MAYQAFFLFNPYVKDSRRDILLFFLLLQKIIEQDRHPDFPYFPAPCVPLCRDPDSLRKITIEGQKLMLSSVQTIKFFCVCQ